MSTESNKRLVGSFYDAGNRGDIDACLDLLSPDVVWTNTGTTPFSGRYAGKAVVISELIGPLFGRLANGIRSTVDQLIAEGEYVAALVRGEAMTQDGRPYNNTYCHVFRIVDGRIVAVTEYLDTALANEVLGRGES
ncbi:MAG TPA: nuclear transport factor 2 family protein [Steroidobacteraceae bacterium]|nr:nuclear transport factor 2 family protein [Steroidobacteraceae bacterium]